ncbi:MAG: Smr/MutS family protein [Spirochaetaceae bacterium]
MDFEDILNQWDKDLKSNPKKKKVSIKKENKVEKPQMSSFLDMYPPDENLAEGEPYKPTQRQKRRNYRRMKPQEVLDLHGFRLVSAIVELEDFLSRCRKRKLEKVLIIHGKGLHSPEGEAVLRNGIRGELKSLNYIGEIGHPSEKEGGAGATWAIIKY